MHVRILLSGLLLLMVGCSKSLKPVTPLYEAGECRRPHGISADVEFCFERLVNDSRCPTGVQCIWPGTAIGEFRFTESGRIHRFTLGTLKRFPFPSPDTTINGYSIRLHTIHPYPGGDARPIAAEVSVTL